MDLGFRDLELGVSSDQSKPESAGADPPPSGTRNAGGLLSERDLDLGSEDLTGTTSGYSVLEDLVFFGVPLLLGPIG